MEDIDVIEILKYFNQSKVSYMKFFGRGIDLVLEKRTEVEARFETPTTTENIKDSDYSIDNCDEINDEEDLKIITSSSVGILTLSKGLKKGKCNIPIKKEDVICDIEAMKIYNNIVSPFDGVITEVFVEDSSMIEYDEKILSIRVNR